MAFKLYTLLSALLVNEITHAARVLSRYRDARRTRFLRIRLRLTVRVKKRPASHRSSSGRDGQITGCHPEDPRCSCIIFIQLLFYKPGFRLSTGRRTAFRYRTSLVTVYPPARYGQDQLAAFVSEQISNIVLPGFRQILLPLLSKYSVWSF